MPSPGGKGGRMPMPGMPGKGGRMPGMPGKGGQMPPDQGMPPTGEEMPPAGGGMPPAGGEVPPAGGTPPADTPTTQTPYEARLLEVMADQGKTREQAIAQQDYAISQGFDTDGDGAVSNAEYSAELARREAEQNNSEEPSDTSGAASQVITKGLDGKDYPNPKAAAAADEIFLANQGGNQPPAGESAPPPASGSEMLAGGNPYLDNLTPEQRALVDQIRQGGFTNPYGAGIGSLYGVGGGMIPNFSGMRF